MVHISGPGICIPLHCGGTGPSAIHRFSEPRMIVRRNAFAVYRLQHVMLIHSCTRSFADRRSTATRCTHCAERGSRGITMVGLRKKSFHDESTIWEKFVFRTTGPCGPAGAGRSEFCHRSSSDPLSTPLSGGWWCLEARCCSESRASETPS